jgi:serpin B
MNQREVEVYLSLPFSVKEADFSGIATGKQLFISSVVHGAQVNVDENGTEAAAATAVVLTTKGFVEEPRTVFRADHPFAFAIRDPAGNILFLGHLIDPGTH